MSKSATMDDKPEPKQQSIIHCVVSWNYNHRQSDLCINIASKFDQCIEVTSLEGKQSQSKVCLKIYARQSSKDCKNGKTSHCSLQSSDLYFKKSNVGNKSKCQIIGRIEWSKTISNRY